MSIRTLLQASIIATVVGLAALAQASKEWQCEPTTNETCTCNVLPGCNPQDGACDCDPQCTDSPGACNWQLVEVATMPVPVYQTVNVFTGAHQYRTDMMGGLPFWPPNPSTPVFYLANDNYAGAVSCPLLSSGLGYYFTRAPTVPIPNTTQLYMFWNPYRGDRVYSVDWNAGSKLPCNMSVGSAGKWDCYFSTGPQGPEGWGLVGRP